MAQKFRIDLSLLQTHAERYDVCQLFQNSNFDIHERWIDVDASHKTIAYIDVVWFYTTEPVFPPLPDGVKIIPQ